MGMYTEINIAFELKKDVPKEVVDILAWLCSSKDEDEPKAPSHIFFECERWRMIFSCDSYYFPGKTHAEFSFDDIADSWFLTARANLKNYGDEIDHFMEWIGPYIYATDGDFIGYSLYEEFDWPTLWHYEAGQLKPTSTETLKPRGEAQ